MCQSAFDNRGWGFWDTNFLVKRESRKAGRERGVYSVQSSDDFVCQRRGPQIIGWLITRVFASSELILVQALIRSRYFSNSSHQRAAYFRLAASSPFRHSIHSCPSLFYHHFKVALYPTYFSELTFLTRCLYRIAHCSALVWTHIIIIFSLFLIRFSIYTS